MESNKPLPERFRLHRPLGRGASGEVLLVGDLLRGRDVALKVLDDPGNPAFRAEFPTLARLSHPSLVRILEWIDGNLCRCCGYPRILKAVHRAAGQAGR